MAASPAETQQSTICKCWDQPTDEISAGLVSMFCLDSVFCSDGAAERQPSRPADSLTYPRGVRMTRHATSDSCRARRVSELIHLVVCCLVFADKAIGLADVKLKAARALGRRYVAEQCKRTSFFIQFYTPRAARFDFDVVQPNPTQLKNLIRLISGSTQVRQHPLVFETVVRAIDSGEWLQFHPRPKEVQLAGRYQGLVSGEAGVFRAQDYSAGCYFTYLLRVCYVCFWHQPPLLLYTGAKQRSWGERGATSKRDNCCGVVCGT